MNKKIIFVGDPHVQVSNLSDSEKVMELVLRTQEKFGAGTLVIAGDLFHTHAVLRMEVVDFWRRWVKELAKSNFTFTYLLVGNHDMPGDKQKEGRMSALDYLSEFEHIRVVSAPVIDINMRGYMPYYSNHEKFLADSRWLFEAGARTLFCHQTFAGSQYENGFYAPDGIKISDMPDFDSIVSGHIHKSQTIGKVFYPGTPKWDSLSDANEQKGIWTFDETEGWIRVDSSDLIDPIVLIELKEGQPIPDLKLTSRTIVELCGQSSWIASVSKKLKGRCRIVARPSDRAIRNAQKERHTSIFDYLEKTQAPNKEAVRQYLEQLCR